MIKQKILVYVPPERMLWIEPILVDVPDLELCFDKDTATNVLDRIKVVVDILQNNSYISINEVIEYDHIFDRIILINCETPGNILDLLKDIDLSKVHFLTTGKINWTPSQMTVIQHENFFGAVQRLYQDDQYVSLKLDPYSTKPFVFDALLGGQKPHRDYVYQRIIDGDLDDKHIYVKYIKNQQRPLSEIIKEESFDWPSDAKIINETNVDQWGTQEQVWFNGKGTASSCIVPLDIYNKCAYSIVTETHTINNHVFITEKTAKCLISRRLFVMFAGSGYLKHLQDLGFQTFSHIIDESYDLEPNRLTRWSRAFDQVERLILVPQNEVFDQCREVLEHNYRLFTSTDWETDFHDNIRMSITA
jgi:hypothetical protein